ncbi:uncharacterized protein B0I36DRAFT_357836 [Microdochium trichocladiopsis]|uniref:Myb-like DNA-binding domain-containing protein n=1 Tax=Microdochium trichocladiopsis TaxID=1682393 RepID=A0A9P8YK86_9PEZI|nr:uncharacterized protein B0I36DRAFT_357836 [Microdochium trichocladiopsis]KAH7040554.1 hypothetical protein B0I36DRAFT_357836 [Microdochium trichocladiopsis]
MAPTTSDETVKFLVACIRHSASGRIDWQAVADECGVPTKNAASMRYTRLLKAHGVTPGGAGGSGGNGGNGAGNGTPANSPAKARATPKKKAAADGEAGSPAKKRKVKGKDKAEDEMEDIETVKNEGDGEDAQV